MTSREMRISGTSNDADCSTCNFEQHMLVSPTMELKFSTELEGFVIEYFKRNRSLWDAKDEFYFDKAKKNELIKDLCGLILDQFGIDVSVGAIKKKWKHLRTSFLREYKKVQGSESGSGSSMMRRSRWIHYKAMQFLKDEEIPEEIANSLQNSDYEINFSTIAGAVDLADLDTVEAPSKEEVPATKEEFPKNVTITTKKSIPAVTESTRSRDSIDAFLEHVNLSLRKFSEVKVQQYILKMQQELVNMFVENE